MNPRSKILVLTNPSDAHSDAVIHFVNKLGGEVVRWHPAEVNTDSTILVARDRDAVSIESSGRTFGLEEISSCWYRRPDPVQDHPNGTHVVDRHLVKQEANAVLWGLYGRLRTTWYSHPYCIRSAAWKLYQLDVAHHVGFRIPDYVVSNRAMILSEFIESHRYVVLKPIDEKTTTFEIDGQPMNLYVKKFAREDLRGLGDNDPISPCLLQEYIDKTSDVRITVIGRQVYCTRILQPSEGEELTDWRKRTLELDHEDIACPDTIREAVLSYNTIMGLNFSAFDFAIGRDGEWYFLECNPNGQWLWIEIKTGVNLAEVFARHLMLLHPPLIANFCGRREIDAMSTPVLSSY